MLRINQLRLKVGHTKEQLTKKAAQELGVKPEEIAELIIVRRSVDARKKPELMYSYVVDVSLAGREREERVLRKMSARCGVERSETIKYRFPKEFSANGQKAVEPIVIVGTGPAGLFCGYYLARHGYCPILLERGQNVEERQKSVERFWQEGVLNLDSNVQFGEGGAGTFSDGKLNTLVKDKYGRNAQVLKTFVHFGAAESILYEAKPHIGTDVLCGIVKRMRKEIIRLGGQVRFDSKVTDILIKDGRAAGVVINGKETLLSSRIVLAIGHSARDTFSMLYEKEIPMEAKAFAVGFRTEHLQKMINYTQYGAEQVKEPGAASYKVTAKTKSGRGVYSFCMCPGGYVVNASSEEGRLAVNGMSYSGRDGENANSAVIVSVTPADFGSEHPLAGIDFQRRLEERAYRLAEGKIPVQRYGDFVKAVSAKSVLCPVGEACADEIKEQEAYVQLQPADKGQYAWADLTGILPMECNQAFVEGMEQFGRKIKGFNHPSVILSGVESRTSSPVRIIRDEEFQSRIRGIFPCGEGAGYAGGITSAAMDGIRVAEAIALSLH